jgi:membrane protein
MELRKPIRALDRYQQRRPWLAVPVATARRFAEDRAGREAAMVAYYAFFSLFPLLLAFVTILGFVLAGHPAALVSVKRSVLGRFPVVGNTIAHDQLKGHALALVAGLALALYAGLGVTQAAASALDHVWAVPAHDRPGFLRSRLRGLALLAALGGMFLLASAASGLVSGGLGGPALAATGIAVSVVLNVAVFLASFKLLCSAEVPVRELAPGAVLAGLAWLALQVIGGVYIGHIAHSDTAYGEFALVIGILAWLHLGAQATVFGAELNVVLARRLWPRPMLGPPAGTESRHRS